MEITLHARANKKRFHTAQKLVIPDTNDPEPLEIYARDSELLSHAGILGLVQFAVTI